MDVRTGTVVAGKVVLDQGALAEGTSVYVIPKSPAETVELSPEERAELDAGLAEADRGELISEEELLRRLERFD